MKKMAKKKRTAQSIFRPLQAQGLDLHARWNLYVSLFSHSSARTDLLKDSAEGFFAQLQMMLVDDVVLRIARLADPAENRSQENLTLAKMLETLGCLADQKLAQRLGGLCAKYKRLAVVIVRHRHKRVAHSDLEFHLQESGLPDISRAEVEGCLGVLRDFMNLIEYHLAECTTSYEKAEYEITGVWKLVAHLRLAIEARQENRSRWRMIVKEVKTEEKSRAANTAHGQGGRRRRRPTRSRTATRP